MTNEVKNVPELRFPNFSEEWEKFVFKDQIISIEKGTDLLGSEDNVGIPLIKMGNIKRGYFSFNKLEKLREIETIQEKYYIKKGDFLFNTRNTMELVGKSATWTNESGKFAFNSNVARLVLKGIDTYFFNYLYNTSKMINKVKSLAVGTTSVAAIYPRDLNHLNYFLPLIAEQEKIGEFFSKLDRQIELEEQKLEKLEEQKKGYMQKIFSQELRFKDESGKDYPEWEIKKLGELYKIVMGQSPKSINYTDDNSYPVLVQGNADIYNGNIFPRIYTKEITKLVKKGDILLTVRAPVGEIGIAQFEACMGRGVCSIEGDKFIYYFLEMFGIQNKWQKLSQGSTFESISGNEVRNIEMPIPSPREREKVSDFFSELDHIINMHSQKIDNMKLRKQGLLQKMFI